MEEALARRAEVDASGEVIRLPRFCPWKEHLYDLEEELKLEKPIKFCIYEVAPPAPLHTRRAAARTPPCLPAALRALGCRCNCCSYGTRAPSLSCCHKVEARLHDNTAGCRAQARFHPKYRWHLLCSCMFGTCH